MEKRSNWLTAKPLAHRGLHDSMKPENTLAAFSAAIQGGYGVEMDLQITKDGVVVVFHDDDLERLTGLKGDIREVTYDFIKDATINHTSEKIPTFTEFLNHLQGKIPVLIEVKDHAKIGPMEQKIIDDLKDYHGDFALQSFNPLIVSWFHRHAPEYRVGQLAGNAHDDSVKGWQRAIGRRPFFLPILGASFLSYEGTDMQRKRILRVKAKMPVLMWTAHSQSEADCCKGYWDNYMFEGFIPR